MRQELCESTTDAGALARSGHHRGISPDGGAPQGAVKAQRVPGPIPILDCLDQTEPLSEPTPIPELRPSVSSLGLSNPVLARLRSPLQFGFTVLLLLDLPFIVYALSWHAGFDLTIVTYPMLAGFLGVSTVAIWLSSRRFVLSKIGVLVARTPMVPWMSLQVFPIIGFVMWHQGGLGSLDRLIPLFVVALAFIFTVGLPNVPWGTSSRDVRWHESAAVRLARVDQSRPLSRW
jgi:hypothetical protein